jgi:nitrite reductase/ring-hydroxylating ferredoxin subunit
MLTVSKIRYFFISLLFILIPLSCEQNKNDVIPDVYIDFTMNLNDPEFTPLTALFGAVYINSNTNNWGKYAAGYGNNGIIVFAGPDEFYAYDRTCPHDYAVNNLSVKVNITDIIYAECPVCKTRYALTNFGTPTSGSLGRYPLKNYRTSMNGYFVRVWNY